MSRRENDLLARIEEAAVSSDGSIADALRMCIALGSQSGSAELRHWANRELRGYDGQADLPTYRRLSAPICIDYVRGNPFVGMVTAKGHRISSGELPEVVAERISEEVEVRQPIAQVDRLAGSHESVRISLPSSAEVVLLMNDERSDWFTNITGIYWSIHPSALAAIVDHVRTSLVDLVAEMRAGLADDAQLPSAEIAGQAVGVAVYGNQARVTLNNARTSEGGRASIALPTRDSHSFWGRVLVGLASLATIVGTVFVGWQVFG